jgi:hypothetical protein
VDEEAADITMTHVAWEPMVSSLVYHNVKYNRCFNPQTRHDLKVKEMTMARFVILYHRTPPGFVRPSHWDLMLQRGGHLRTWSLSSAPETGECVAAEPLPPHDQKYLDYEGPVSQDRGHVARWDQGDYQIELERDDLLQMVFHGQRLRGRAKLWRDPLSQRWWFVLEGD